MKAIINGKRYDTDTADLICRIPCSLNRGDFGWHHTGVYCTPKGAYFLSGEGNAASMWARSTGQNSSGAGSGIRPITPVEAREYLEDAGEWDEIESRFPIEDA